MINRNAMPHLVFLIFALSTAWAYWPSLQHAPKHDQIGYLAEMAQRNGLWDKTIGAYSWHRDRAFMRGDELLFRPVFNVFLGIQLVLFGYNYSLWQGMSIVLHLMVGFFMFRLLSTIQPGMSAAVTAGFFLLMLSNVPMVVWHAINGYMLFCVFLLESLVWFVRYQRDRRDRMALWISLTLMLMSAFTYDAGVFFIAAAAVFFLFDEKFKPAWLLFLAAAGCYFAGSMADFLYRHLHIQTETGKVLGGSFSVQTILNAGTALKWFFCTGIFLHARDIVSIERVVVTPLTLDFMWPFKEFSLHMFRGITLICVSAGVMFLSVRAVTRSTRQVLVLLVLMLVSFMFFISVGRLNTRGILTGLLFNSYYTYIFWVLVLPAVYAGVGFEALATRSDGKMIRGVAYFLLLIFILFNGVSVYNVNTMIAQVDRNRRSFLDTAETFVQAHRLESGFTFYASSSCPGNYPGKWLHKAGDPLWRRYTFSEILYPQYYSRVHPEYIISCGDH